MDRKHIRQAFKEDVSRIAEIIVFNNRENYYPIFGDIRYSFGILNVLSVAQEYLAHESLLSRVWIYEDESIVKGFIRVWDGEIEKLYVDTFFQNQGIGAALIDHAVAHLDARRLWVLERNEGALRFYERHGFSRTSRRVLEEGTPEYLVMLKYSPDENMHAEVSTS